MPPLLPGQKGLEHYREERAQTAQAMAEQIIAEELKRQRWKEVALKTRPKGDPAKTSSPHVRRSSADETRVRRSQTAATVRASAGEWH